MRLGTRLNLHCKKCGRAYKNAGALNEHLNRHREETQRIPEWRKRLTDRDETGQLAR